MEAHIYRVKAKGQAHKSQRYDNKTKRPRPQAAASCRKAVATLLNGSKKGAVEV